MQKGGKSSRFVGSAVTVTRSSGSLTGNIKCRGWLWILWLTKPCLKNVVFFKRSWHWKQNRFSKKNGLAVWTRSWVVPHPWDCFFSWSKHLPFNFKQTTLRCCLGHLSLWMFMGLGGRSGTSCTVTAASLEGGNTSLTKLCGLGACRGKYKICLIFNSWLKLRLSWAPVPAHGIKHHLTVWKHAQTKEAFITSGSADTFWRGAELGGRPGSYRSPRGPHGARRRAVAALRTEPAPPGC